jgi:hypothetical protein
VQVNPCLILFLYILMLDMLGDCFTVPKRGKHVHFGDIEGCSSGIFSHSEGGKSCCFLFDNVHVNGAPRQIRIYFSSEPTEVDNYLGLRY